jgi:hypothetical protein
MEQSKADEIASVWRSRFREEWKGIIAEVLRPISEPDAWAIAGDHRLALLAEGRLYILEAEVEPKDQLAAIRTDVLDLDSPFAGLEFSSDRRYSWEGKPMYGAHTWTLKAAVLEAPLEFQVGRLEGDALALWNALAGLEQPVQPAPESPS